MFKKLFLISLLLTSVTFAFNLDDISQQGSRWFGGNLSFTSIRSFGDEDPDRTMSISSITRFYPATNFILGPKFSLARSSSAFYEGERYSSTLLDFGGEVGFSGFNNGKVMPYFVTNPSLTLAVANFAGESDSEPTFKLHSMLGLLIFINDYVGLQVEPTYTIYPVEEFHYIGFNFGFAFNIGRDLFSLTTSTTF